MSVINFSGLASGIDTNALIDATSSATRQRRVVPLQKEVTELTETNDVLGQLKAKLSTLQTKLKLFSSLNGGGVSKQVTSNNETVATATASNSASTNSYTLTVSQLARQSTVSFSAPTYTSTSNPLLPTINDTNTDAQRTMSVTYGTGGDAVTKTFVLTSTTTAEAFVADFNTKFAGRASASFVNTGTVASPVYKIMMTSSTQGEAKGRITFALDGAPDAALNTWVNTDRDTSQALNAQFSLSGLSGTIERSSNTVTDLLTGVSFSLLGTGTSTLQVKTDSATTKAKFKEAIDAWNDVLKLINENDKVQTSQSNSGDLQNTFLPLASTSLDDSLVSQLRNSLSSVKSYSTTDAEADTNGIKIRILSDIGVTSNGRDADGAADGTLNLAEDSSDNLTYNFESALDKEPDSVATLLQNLSEVVAGTGKLIDNYIGFNRIIETTVSGNTRRITDLNDDISDIEAYILDQEASLRQRYASLESLVGRLQQQQSALTSSLSGLGK